MSDEKTCYADEVTHRRCKYSINRGWKEKTCKNVSCDYKSYISGDYYFICSECDARVFAVAHDGGADVIVYCGDDEVGIRFCPICGARVID